MHHPRLRLLRTALVGCTWAPAGVVWHLYGVGATEPKEKITALAGRASWLSRGTGQHMFMLSMCPCVHVDLDAVVDASEYSRE